MDPVIKMTKPITSSKIGYSCIGKWIHIHGFSSNCFSKGLAINTKRCRVNVRVLVFLQLGVHCRHRPLSYTGRWYCLIQVIPLLHQQVGYITIHHIEEQLQFLNYTPPPTDLKQLNIKFLHWPTAGLSRNVCYITSSRLRCIKRVQ